jgi:uncharacterized repeat protein (TIGR03806 family)
MKKLFGILFCASMLIVTSCGSDDDAYVDNEQPSSPLNLVITNSSIGDWMIAWEMATDNEGVSGYNIYVDGLLLQGNVSGTNFTISNLTDYNQYSVFVTALDAEGNESEISNTITCTFLGTPLEFKPTLSEMGIFQGNLGDIAPADGVQPYELNTSLYTDYSKKQRLIRLPNCQTMNHNDDLLPDFPNNTIMSKTFYYDLDETNGVADDLKIIETRVVIKINGEWLLGNYVWNDSQTEAVLDNSGGIVPFDFINETGTTVSLNYEIPNADQCIQCHHSYDQEIIIIGAKLRNMNLVPSFTGQNQLDYFIEIGLLDGIQSSSEVSILPNWEDTSLSLSDRGRAYLDVQCAHCHSPGGEVPPFLFTDYRFETPIEDAGITSNVEEIKSRFNSTTFGFSMPLLGRTILHEEGKTLLFEYLDSL